MTPENVCKPIHDIINYSTFICPFEPGKLGKQGKKYKDLNISRTNKALLLKKKNIFIVFEALSFGKKNENLIKYSEQKF